MAEDKKYIFIRLDLPKDTKLSEKQQSVIIEAFSQHLFKKIIIDKDVAVAIAKAIQNISIVYKSFFYLKIDVDTEENLYQVYTILLEYTKREPYIVYKNKSLKIDIDFQDIGLYPILPPTTFVAKNGVTYEGDNKKMSSPKKESYIVSDLILNVFPNAYISPEQKDGIIANFLEFMSRLTTSAIKDVSITRKNVNLDWILSFSSRGPLEEVNMLLIRIIKLSQDPIDVLIYHDDKIKVFLYKTGLTPNKVQELRIPRVLWFQKSNLRSSSLNSGGTIRSTKSVQGSLHLNIMGPLAYKTEHEKLVLANFRTFVADHELGIVESSTIDLKDSLLLFNLKGADKDLEMFNKKVDKLLEDEGGDIRLYSYNGDEKDEDDIIVFIITAKEAKILKEYLKKKASSSLSEDESVEKSPIKEKALVSKKTAGKLSPTKPIITATLSPKKTLSSQVVNREEKEMSNKKVTNKAANKKMTAKDVKTGIVYLDIFQGDNKLETGEELGYDYEAGLLEAFDLFVHDENLGTIISSALSPEDTFITFKTKEDPEKILKALKNKLAKKKIALYSHLGKKNDISVYIHDGDSVTADVSRESSVSDVSGEKSPLNNGKKSPKMNSSKKIPTRKGEALNQVYIKLNLQGGLDLTKKDKEDIINLVFILFSQEKDLKAYKLNIKDRKQIAIIVEEHIYYLAIDFDNGKKVNHFLDAIQRYKDKNTDFPFPLYAKGDLTVSLDEISLGEGNIGDSEEPALIIKLKFVSNKLQLSKKQMEDSLSKLKSLLGTSIKGLNIEIAKDGNRLTITQKDSKTFNIRKIKEIINANLDEEEDDYYLYYTPDASLYIPYRLPLGELLKSNSEEEASEEADLETKLELRIFIRSSRSLTNVQTEKAEKRLEDVLTENGIKNITASMIDGGTKVELTQGGKFLNIEKIKGILKQNLEGDKFYFYRTKTVNIYIDEDDLKVDKSASGSQAQESSREEEESTETKSVKGSKSANKSQKGKEKVKSRSVSPARSGEGKEAAKKTLISEEEKEPIEILFVVNGRALSNKQAEKVANTFRTMLEESGVKVESVTPVNFNHSLSVVTVDDNVNIYEALKDKMTTLGGLELYKTPKIEVYISRATLKARASGKSIEQKKASPMKLPSPKGSHIRAGNVQSSKQEQSTSSSQQYSCFKASYNVDKGNTKLIQKDYATLKESLLEVLGIEDLTLTPTLISITNPNITWKERANYNRLLSELDNTKIGPLTFYYKGPSDLNMVSVVIDSSKLNLVKVKEYLQDMIDTEIPYRFLSSYLAEAYIDTENKTIALNVVKDNSSTGTPVYQSYVDRLMAVGL